MSVKSLTHERLKELFSYDPLLGVFTRLIKPAYRREPAGIVSGLPQARGYARIMIDQKSYLAHRLAWFYVRGEWPNEIDHINGVRDDNRMANLREVGRLENNRNTKLYKTNKSGIGGVYFRERRGKWLVYIGSSLIADSRSAAFNDFFEACCARKSAENRLGYHKNHGTPRHMYKKALVRKQSAQQATIQEMKR